MLVFLCALLAAPVSAVVVQLGPKDAQGFMDAIASFGSSGEDTTILLPGGVFSLEGGTKVDANPTPGTQPFSAGTLTIAPADESTTTILDTRMLYGLASVNGTVTVFSGTAELHLKNLTLINLCDLKVLLDPANGVFFSSAFSVGMLQRTRSRQSHLHQNVTLYSRPADLSSFPYVQWMLRTRSKKLAELTQSIVQGFPTSVTNSTLLTANAGLATYSLPAGNAINVTLRSTADPFDPLLLSMRAARTLMEHRYCKPNETGSPPFLVDPVTSGWLTTDTTSWVEALAAATLQQAQPTTGYRSPAAIMLAGAALPAVLPAPPRMVPLTGALLLTAQYNDLPGAVVEGVLDMTGSSKPLMQVADTGLLFIQGMKLKGLAARPLPGPTPGPASVLPLSAFPLASNSAAIELHNVTLVLPADDYLALLTLALQGTAADMNACVTASTRAHAAALQAGITALQVEQVGAQYQSVVLSTFAGWGLNASALVLQPEDPVLLYTLWASCQQSASSSTEEIDWKVEFIVACSVAGVAVCAAVVLGLLLLRQNRSHASTATPVHLNSTAAGGGPQPQAGSKSPSSKNTNSPVFSALAVNSMESGGIPSVHRLAEASGSQSTPAVVEHASPVMTPVQPSLQQVVTAANTAATGLVGLSTEALLQMTAAASAAVMRPSQAGLPMGAGEGAGGGDGGEAEDELVAGGDENVRRNVVVVLTRGLTKEAEEDLGVHQGPQSNDSQQDVAPLDMEQQQQLHRLQQKQQRWRQQLHLDDPLNPQNPQQQETTPSFLDDQLSQRKPQQQEARVNSFLLNTGSSARSMSDPHAAISQMMHKITPKSDGANELVEVEGLLGTGSWGIVYKGRWRGLHVALKTLVFEAEGIPAEEGKGGAVKVQEHAKAIMEAAVAASVDHANVVRTYYYDIKPLADGWEAPGSAHKPLQISMQEEGIKQFKLFLVQELCATSLDVILNQGVLHNRMTGMILDPVTPVRLLLDVATGLGYLHSRNIIHGDLKPANVLLKPSQYTSEGVVAKLADFGLSAHLGGGATHLSHYRGGTPFYVAPEVVQEHRTSTAADVYSFGVLAWRLYTGLRQYKCSPDGEYSWNPLFPCFHRPNIPAPAYQMLVHSCLQRDPRLRPTATDLTRELLLMHQVSTQAQAAASTSMSLPAGL